MAGEDCVVRAWAGLHFAYREMSRLLDERLRAESECSLSDVDVLNELYCTRRDRPARNRREVYAAVTEEGARVLGHARTVYIRLLTETLGAHLDDAALDDLAAGMAKLRAGLAEAGGR